MLAVIQVYQPKLNPIAGRARKSAREESAVRHRRRFRNKLWVVMLVLFAWRLVP
jgi:hypothetical protein